MPSITFNVDQELKDDFDYKVAKDNKKRKGKDKITKTDLFVNFMKYYTYGRKK